MGISWVGYKVSHNEKEEAEKILAEYGLRLPEKWEDKINVWHKFHHSPIFLIWRITYEDYISRILSIYHKKDPWKVSGFSLMSNLSSKDRRQNDLMLSIKSPEFK